MCGNGRGISIPRHSLPHGRERLLHEREQHVAVGERHLDVELRDLLHAVGAQVLVPEADRDLVVAVEAGDHRQLLEELRALRQREERPLVQPARHDEVAGALRCRLEQDRRLDVEEPGRLHVPADDPDHLCAQADVALQLVAAQVEPAVAQAQRLVDVLLVELERQRRRAGDDRERVDLQLDLARRHAVGLTVSGARATTSPSAWSTNSLRISFASSAASGRTLGVDHELRDPGAVAQVDEDEAAVVAAARGPARERLARADVLGAQLPAHEIAPAHARQSAEDLGVAERSRPARPGRRRTASPAGRSRSWRRRAARLGQLALQRPARVVGVRRDTPPARRARRASARRPAAGRRRRERRRRRSSAARPSRRRPPSRSAAARDLRRSRRRASAARRSPRRARRSARRRRSSSSRCPSGRRTPRSCACSSRARAPGSGRACTRLPSRRGRHGRRRNARRTPRRATRRSWAPRRAPRGRLPASQDSCRTRATGSPPPSRVSRHRAGARCRRATRLVRPDRRAGIRGSRSS